MRHKVADQFLHERPQLPHFIVTIFICASTAQSWKFAIGNIPSTVAFNLVPCRLYLNFVDTPGQLSLEGISIGFPTYAHFVFGAGAEIDRDVRTVFDDAAAVVGGSSTISTSSISANSPSNIDKFNSITWLN